MIVCCFLLRLDSSIRHNRARETDVYTLNPISRAAKDIIAQIKLDLTHKHVSMSKKNKQWEVILSKHGEEDDGTDVITGN